MAQPPVFNWATSVGGTVVSGLTITAAQWVENQQVGNVLYGLIRYTCSGSPDLSGVLQSHRLDVSNMANALNDGVHYIVSADNTAKTITVRMTARTDNSLDETGSSGAGVVYDLGALLQEPSGPKQAQGYIPGEKPNAQQLNWMLNGFGAWTNYLATGDAGIIGVADLTALAAIDTTGFIGRAALVAGIGVYRWVSGSALTADGYTVIDSDVDGQWVLNAGQTLTFTQKLTAGGTWTHDLETLPGKIAKLTVDASDVSTNDVLVKVDGSTIDTLTPGQKEWYLVEPTTSVEVEAEVLSFDLSAASFDSGQSYNASARIIGTCESVVFSPDRANMYVLDQNGASTAIHHYTLSTPGQLSSGVSYVSSLTIGGTYPNSTGLHLRPDGTRIYIFSNDTNRPAAQYNLGTPFTLAGATAGGAINIQPLVSWTGAATDLFITDDGTKLLALAGGGASSMIYQFTLGTAHDITTATYDSVSLTLTSEDNNLNALHWTADKTKLFVVGGQNDRVRVYATTGGSISGAVIGTSFSVSAQTGSPFGLWFSPDGFKFYISGGSTNRTIYRYSSGVNFAGTARVHLSYQL